MAYIPTPGAENNLLQRVRSLDFKRLVATAIMLGLLSSCGTAPAIPAPTPKPTTPNGEIVPTYIPLTYINKSVNGTNLTPETNSQFRFIVEPTATPFSK